MRSAISRSGWTVAASLMMLMVMATPVFAQGSQSSVFQMFFWADNIIGLVVTWGLILLSVCVMALAIKHIMDNRLTNIMPEENVMMYDDMLQEKRFRDAIEQASEDDTPFGQIIHASLSEAANGYGAMERAIEETTDLIGSKRIRSVEILNVIGAVGPMIGLFGTIYGMIVAFQTIVDEGGQPDPAALAGGISTALVTTFWGLIVGIPAVTAGALIRNKIDGLMVEVMIRAEMLIGQFQPGSKKTAAKAQAAGGAAAEGGKAAPKPRPA